MGSALGPVMAGIFVGFHEVDLFSKYKAPEVYFRYVDDTFCVFGSETEPGEFFTHLNNMHPVLRFSLERENNFTLPIFTNPSAREGYDSRSIFKRSLTGLNSEFSFS